jgi:hypothetical protein
MGWGCPEIGFKLGRTSNSCFHTARSNIQHVVSDAKGCFHDGVRLSNWSEQHTKEFSTQFFPDQCIQKILTG